ncbi:MAG: FAD/NAD(P)-binding protein [Terriglobales bacterium]|jgi:uncharacterized NAD(P)/FAD-binding protein YdhS
MNSITEHRRNEGEKAVRCTIAIVGGGFTGSMLAVQLLRRAAGTVSVALIERSPLLGRGVAYGTQFDEHLLNVRAKNMSAYPDVPDHFVKWAQHHYSSSVKPDDFLARPLYGRYIASQLQDAGQSLAGELRSIQDEAVSLARVGNVAEVLLAGGQTVVADKVVLALGNFPPGDRPLPEKTARGTRYVSNPWSAKTLLDVRQDKSVLLIGSGLTSVDMVVELRARGFEGTIHLLSRRGLLPQSHRATVTLPPFWGEASPRTARGLLRLIRLEVKAAGQQGSDWRAVIDSLRPVTPKIWQTLPRMERRRFLRHLRTYWDVHRHRIAEQIADQLASQLESGHLRMHAGRITEYHEVAGGVEITYRSRKSGDLAKLCVDRVVNCTGPEADCRRVDSPLLSELMEKGLARPDELSLGMDITDDGNVVDAQGTASDFLYVVGPLRKGSLWETIAVPEIRVQVVELAELLLARHRTEDSATESSVAGPEVSTPFYY